ncbi:hypothetical protein FKM82_014243 [Ascaphus truei]|uniref:thymocyte nuclear protein 1 isoform X2 n=1 Tax=Ascaphus truei TaxID=8439 RepID=UPI003F5A31D1
MRQTKRKRGSSPPADHKEPSDNVGDGDAEEERKSKGIRGRKKTVKCSSSEQREEYHCWLMKSEPESRMEKGVDMKFGIDDLKAQPDQTACWDGVRNYQIVKEAYVDHTQFDGRNPHQDSSSSQENPKWSMVDVQFVRMMKRYIPLAELKQLHQKHKVSGGPLRHMALFVQQRLSVQPLTQEEFDFVLSLEDQKSA